MKCSDWVIETYHVAASLAMVTLLEAIALLLLLKVGGESALGSCRHDEWKEIDEFLKEGYCSFGSRALE